MGFRLNHKKCVWARSQVVDFLGFRIDSTTMKLFLPEEKIDKILKECRHLLNKTVVLVRNLAHLIGLLSSTLPAVKIALLHYRALQRLRHQILMSSQGEYDRTAPLSNKCQEDLHWWLAHLRDANGHSPSADLTITTDASKTGWSATNQKLSTRGV